MTGVYKHSLDNKGRIFVPSKLREELGDIFYITISMDACLNAYSGEDWQLLTKKVNAMPYIEQRKIRPIFSNAAKCELDAQGRVLLPQALRDYAGLSKNVAVVGVNNHVEFWNLEKWEEVSALENEPENIVAIMEALDF